MSPTDKDLTVIDPTCPSCGEMGDLEEQLANRQRRCPTDRDVCRVITFEEEREDGS